MNTTTMPCFKESNIFLNALSPIYKTNNTKDTYSSMLPLVSSNNLFLSSIDDSYRPVPNINYTGQQFNR